MKITDMILIIENNRGTESSLLCTFLDFVHRYLTHSWSGPLEVARVIQDLEHTRGKVSYSHICYAANQTVYARYCKDLNELRDFLQSGKDRPLDMDHSNWECLALLERLGFDENTLTLTMPWHYEQQKRIFEVGEVLHNFNQHDYRVMEVFSDRNLLLMDVDTGGFVVGIGTDSFAKYPKGENIYSGLCEQGIEWGHGIYLGNVPDLREIAALRQTYGDGEKDGENEADICEDMPY